MENEKPELIISNVTTYDPDDDLYFTKVGTNQKDMPLLYICCGNTMQQSRGRAEVLVAMLNFKNFT